MGRVGPLAGVDIDALFYALRPRIIALLGGGGGTGIGPPGPKGLVWRGEWEADENYEIGDLVYLTTAGGAVLTWLCLTAQTSLPGAEPTVGGDTNWWELGPGYLIIDGSRPMIGDLDHGLNDAMNIKSVHLTGDMGDGLTDGVRHLSLTGSEADAEGREDGVNAVVFNPVTAVDPEEGRTSWDATEGTFGAFVRSGSGVAVVLVALGWACLSAINGE